MYDRAQLQGNECLCVTRELHASDTRVTQKRIANDSQIKYNDVVINC